MNQTEDFNYYEEEGLKIVELPYKTTLDQYNENGDYVDTKVIKDIQPSMYLILSDKENIDAERILNTKKLENRLVNLSMPKFKIEWSDDLINMLKEIGMQKALSDNAEFDNILSNEILEIDQVLHKTYINVNENETEAATATAVLMKATAPKPENPVVFKADRPFTYVIRDNISGEILFMGEYAYAE